MITIVILLGILVLFLVGRFFYELIFKKKHSDGCSCCDHDHTQEKRSEKCNCKNKEKQKMSKHLIDVMAMMHIRRQTSSL